MGREGERRSYHDTMTIYGFTSRGCLESMRSHLEGFRGCGREFRRSGIILGWRSVGNKSMPRRVEAVVKAKGGHTKH